MKVIIRQAKYGDLAQVSDLNKKCLAENYPKDYWTELQQKSGNNCFVAVYGGEIIGYCFCNGETIISIAIEEKYRGKGLGKMLMKWCLNSTKNEINLHVRISNDRAMTMYKNLGFTPRETIKDYYDSPKEDGLIMVIARNRTIYPLGKKIKV